MNSAALRDELVDRLIESGVIASDPVERAFRRVPRDRYLERWYRYDSSRTDIPWRPVDFDREHPSEEALREIYSNQALVTCCSGVFATSSTSQPSIVGLMLELLALEPGMNVLEIGTGTGYNAALMAEIVGEHGTVVSVESQAPVARRARRVLEEEGHTNVRVLHRDGFDGFDEGAPFDRIVATVGCGDISPRWIEQITSDGRLLIPLIHGEESPLVSIWRSERSGEVEGRTVESSSFMEAGGLLGAGSLWRSILFPRGIDKEVWRRPLPAPIRGDDSGEEAKCKRRDLKFFVALCSRHLWGSRHGYGIADPASCTAVVIQGQEVVAFGEDARAADRLYESLEDYVARWDRMGRPRPTDFKMVFLRRDDLLRLRDHETGWMIFRPHHVQIIRLDVPNATGDPS